MGSDYHMNPPQKVWERHNVDTEDEVMEWIIGAMANGFEVNVSRYDPMARDGEGFWMVSIFKGEWA